MMLDSKRTFDDIIERFAPHVDARERILKNHVYRHVSTRLAGAHEYMAMEKLFELANDGRWDTVVVDTPPTRHALDFLRAPEKLANLMDEGVMRWLVLPASRGGWRMIERGSEVLANILQRFLGERTITDIAEFFAALQSLWDGFRERSLQVRALLRAPSTRFLLVTTPAPTARAEALEFLDLLTTSHMPFGGFLLNRCAVATREAGPVSFGPPSPDPTWAATVEALTELPARRARQVAAQEMAIHELRTHAPAGAAIWRLPDFALDLHDLDGLCRFAATLPDLSVRR
jgi:anion-transporting  ArsA/GET3 family ATPase